MAIKSRSAVGLLFMALICLFSYCGYIFFETVVSICVIYVCASSLYSLIVYNFASDAVFDKYLQKYNTKAPISEEDAFLIKVKNVFLNVLFLIYFAGIIVFDKSYAFRIPAFLVFMLWSFDFLKNNLKHFKKSVSEEWDWKDSVFEVLMWGQNILSIVIAIFKLMTI